MKRAGRRLESDVMVDTSGPFLVAHRAGNDLSRLRRAEALGIGLVEADVHLFAGRLEVRHLKTAGPLPVLWDRWRLAPSWTPRLELPTLLAATQPTTELMLDLKGRDVRLAGHVARALAAAPRVTTVCSRNWALLEPMRRLPHVLIVHSVGSARQLSAVWRLLDDGRLAGVSVHRRLLDARVVARLRTAIDLLLSWPVEDETTARTLAGWGVHGLISQGFERLAPAVAVR